MEDVYALELAIHERDLDIFRLETFLKDAQNKNRELKQQLEALAMENSAMCKKRAISKFVRERWAYYHASKTRVKEARGLDDWRAVKKVCDELFAEANIK